MLTVGVLLPSTEKRALCVENIARTQLTEVSFRNAVYIKYGRRLVCYINSAILMAP